MTNEKECCRHNVPFSIPCGDCLNELVISGPQEHVPSELSAGLDVSDSSEEEKKTFGKELTNLINRHSMENGSDTPDWILAQYMNVCLVAFTQATNQREKWYGRGEEPVCGERI